MSQQNVSKLREPARSDRTVPPPEPAPAKARTPASGPTVRAIDVGFGLVKYTLPGEGGTTCKAFPSLAIPADTSAVRSLSTRRRDTFDVPVQGALYEVGRDVGLALAGGSFGRDVTDEFYRGKVYEAVTKGALRYMAEAGDATIDVLVLGLPVNQFNDSVRRDYLRRTYEGDLDVGDGKTVKVARVVVQAQPMGGYADLENHLEALNREIADTPGALEPLASADDLDELAVLMVDPGEHTLDWLLIQQGTINPSASSAASDAGRHRVLRTVQAALSEDVGRPLGVSIEPHINEALRQNKPVKLSGVAYDLAKYEPRVMSVIEDAVNRMIDGLRDATESVDLIAIVGGHPERYRDALKQRFPAIPVFVLPDAVTANVRGFQMIGEAVAET